MSPLMERTRRDELIEIFHRLKTLKGYGHGNDCDVAIVLKRLTHGIPVLSMLFPRYLVTDDVVSCVIGWSYKFKKNHPLHPDFLYLRPDGFIDFDRYNTVPYYKKLLAHLNSDC